MVWGWITGHNLAKVLIKKKSELLPWILRQQPNSSWGNKHTNRAIIDWNETRREKTVEPFLIRNRAIISGGGILQLCVFSI